MRGLTSDKSLTSSVLYLFEIFVHASWNLFFFFFSFLDTIVVFSSILSPLIGFKPSDFGLIITFFCYFEDLVKRHAIH